jgi:hypothetical protein
VRRGSAKAWLEAALLGGSGVGLVGTLFASIDLFASRSDV